MNLVDDPDERLEFPPAACCGCGAGVAGAPLLAQSTNASVMAMSQDMRRTGPRWSFMAPAAAWLCSAFNGYPFPGDRHRMPEPVSEYITFGALMDLGRKGGVRCLPDSSRCPPSSWAPAWR